MRLSLAEELLLLSLRDDKGTVVNSASMGLPFGLAGAVLMELALQEKIRIEGKKLVAAPAGEIGDAILDRLVHNAYTLNLTGESMRKRQTPLTNPTTGQ